MLRHHFFFGVYSHHNSDAFEPSNLLFDIDLMFLRHQCQGLDLGRGKTASSINKTSSFFYTTSKIITYGNTVSFLSLINSSYLSERTHLMTNQSLSGKFVPVLLVRKILLKHFLLLYEG